MLRGMVPRLVWALALAASPLLGCYYYELGAGHLAILNAQRPVSQALAEEPDRGRRTMLRLVPRIRAFARDVLQLRPGDNYTGYYATQARGVTHIVVAAERTRLQAYEWWFPIVGSAPYKGYFEEGSAHAEAQSLAQDGYDVWIVRGSAYSTLGLSRDPVTTVMMRRGPTAFVELLLHEMTHARLYVPGQVDFNEQLASFVGRLGAERFFRQYHPDDPVYLRVLRRAELRRDKLERAVRASAEALQELYGSGRPEAELLREREVVFERLSRYASALYPRDPATDCEMNNARILQDLRYQRRSDYLEELWRHSGRNWRRFWRLVEDYARQL